MQKLKLLVFILFLSCNDRSGKQVESEGETTNVVTENTDTSHSPVTKISTSKSVEFNLKNEVKLGDFVIKVNKIVDFKASEPMNSAKPGYKFVSIEVEYLNPTTDRQIECNLGDWKLYDQEDYAYDFAANYKQPELPFTVINPGKHVKGWVTFEVQQSSQKFKVQFKPDPYNDANVEIKLY